MIMGFAIFFTILSIIVSYRVVVGPTITDRLIGADTIGIFMSLVMLMIALEYDISLLVDIVLAYAVLLFIDMLIYAKYFEHGELYR
ncbi:multicomponent Na+:H+ antiporter subunit F [Halanaerobium saccharolyticum]|uniref:Multicomponent Na+:H+ antiporter subunit F n=1 Tax=Halanaerobium saccharolyticum TaxID=43595 RepID=A0A4R7Z147_9FIRM|nr:monovalent cation/H+ antiporter complex subunit F [Halanaerobium saccharolyticum]RAK08141.1 multicomponent Na+:H+ antiporter subunit F [Halanaerobium saccharolyticum]TDW04348.1 multicomponent Na+:H+ antiporter subunit F [Halanaerobium saccharolyticum]TDX59639.1 multicomponent Na+:H+ antiporter subunit F [Halanaerobium saccharolyticum]